MRRFLACTLGVLILTSSVIDHVCCVDDCGRGDQLSTNVSTPGAVDCALCAGVVAPAVMRCVTDVALLEAVPPARLVLPVLLIATALDHPPRA